MAFDGFGNLYVENEFSNNVTVYAPGSSSPLRTISQSVNGPDALLFDGSGNLYVANYDSATVTVYAEGSTKPLRTISHGVDYPASLAFGP